MALLQVVALSKRFGPAAVLQSVSFQVEEGESVCLLGPSGCGKTTLLRCIAGLEAPDEGEVLLEGRSIAGVPVHQRGFGLMFQDYALFPHQDVAANVAFGLRMQQLSRGEVQGRVREMLGLVGLLGAERRRVYDLSGGEQQRVALARSLAPRPRLLMLDEPLGSLDRALREELMHEVRQILRRVGVTTLYVTHDQQEAFAMADRVLIMNRGRLVQEGTPEEVYRQPASSWVARFLGSTNLVPGRVVSIHPPEVDTPLGRFPVAAVDPLRAGQGACPELGRRVTLLLRPEAARLASDCPGQDALLLEGLVQECVFRGGHYHMVVRHASGVELIFEVVAGAAALPRPGEKVVLALQAEAIGVLEEASE